MCKPNLLSDFWWNLVSGQPTTGTNGVCKRFFNFTMREGQGLQIENFVIHFWSCVFLVDAYEIWPIFSFSIINRNLKMLFWIYSISFRLMTGNSFLHTQRPFSFYATAMQLLILDFFDCYHISNFIQKLLSVFKRLAV